jgi:hypothetical protein
MNGYHSAISDEQWPAGRGGPPEFDVTVPNVARMYDYLLNGKTNYAADREAADAVLRQVPHAPQAAKENRAFLGRAVRSLADQGIRQFLDIGSGLPTVCNVHEVAQGAAPESRIVYVDYDHMVVTHARALMGGWEGVSVLEADLREPEKIIREADGALDFSQPVGLLLFAILHFLDDGERPHEIVRALAGALAPGSAVAVSHITADGLEDDQSQAAQKVYQGATAPAVPRSRGEIARFFDGLSLVEPGVTDINDWPGPAWEPGPLAFYGGVAVKP